MVYQQPVTGNEVTVTFLAQGEQNALSIAQRVAAFIAGAQHSLDFALYDMRLSPPVAAIVTRALAERAAAGVRIRIAYDADKPAQPALAQGGDPAPAGTGAFVQSLGYPYRRIGGPKLMHDKYILRDAPDFVSESTSPASSLPTTAVWTGSTNFTDDSWTVEENNILVLVVPALARDYARDFADLWLAGEIGTSGNFDTSPVITTYAGAPLTAQVFFAPGRGEEIDHRVADAIAGAQRRVRIASMLLNSGTFINALTQVLDAGAVPVSGIYDRTQMQGVLPQWQGVPSNVWKIAAVRDIVQRAQLVGKNTTPYRPDTIHDFMHDKLLVVDDTVITGSYNFSRSAMQNAENVLFLQSAALADQYSAYVDHLMAKYANHSRGEL